MLVVVLMALLGLSLLATPATGSWGTGADSDPGDGSVELLLFWGDGCPHCAAEKVWLADLQDEYAGLEIKEYEVWYDAENRELFEQVAEDHGLEPQGVPGTFVGGAGWIGFNDAIAFEIEEAVRTASQGGTPDASEQAVVSVPFVGDVDLGDSSLLVSTLVIGFVDGVNPCSLWVLTMLLALVLHSGSRRRVAAVGGTFLLVTSAMYALYIVGIFSVLTYVGYLDWIQRAVALLVAVLGLLQIKDYVWFHQGPSLGIGEGAQPGLFRRMRGLAAHDRPLPAVLLATTGLAIGVSLLETPCTVGLPMIWANLVSQQEVGSTAAAVLFLLYMAVFLLDELLVFGVAVATMRATKLQERHGRELKLVSGTVMLTLAAVMIAAPQVMESVWGALGVFGLVAAVVAVVLAAGRARERARVT
jgi:cytochrome c biogenesis protein CcdA/glutaredoxin